MRSLNDPHQGSLPTVQTVTPLTAQRFRDRRLNDLRSAARSTRSTGTDASVTFRPLILTPFAKGGPFDARDECLVHVSRRCFGWQVASGGPHWSLADLWRRARGGRK